MGTSVDGRAAGNREAGGQGHQSSSRLWLASRIAAALAVALPGRAVHLVGDAAYAEGTAPARAGLHLDHKAAQGRRAARSSAGKDRAARPARDRDRLPTLAKLAARQVFIQVTVACYGKAVTVHAASLTCGIPSSVRGSSRWC